MIGCKDLFLIRKERFADEGECVVSFSREDAARMGEASFILRVSSLMFMAGSFRGD